LEAQLAQAAEAVVPQRRPEDPLEAASRRAHQVLDEVTRGQAPAVQERPLSAPLAVA
jgi:hypothetical protein